MGKDTQPGMEAAQSQRGSNQITVRSHNERLILGLVRRNGELSKSEAARLTGLSNNATSVILRALEKENLLLKGEPIRGKVGQPSIPMRINPDARYYLALRIGRRAVELAVINFAGEIIGGAQQSVPYPTPGQVKDFFRDHLTKVLRAAKVRKPNVSGMSVVMPFELWSWTDEFDAPVSEMLDWKDFDIATALQPLVPCPVIIENDGTAACRAELLFGQHPDKSDWIYFYIGTFVGGGVVLHNRLFAGKRGNAGGFGPMRVPERHGRDRLVDHASLVVLERALARNGKTPPPFMGMAQDDQTVVPELNDWIERAAHGLAHAIVSSLAIIDFEGVVIDGALSDSVKIELVQAVTEKLRQIDVQGVEPPRIEPGQMGPNARLLGAAAVQIDRSFPATD